MQHSCGVNYVHYINDLLLYIYSIYHGKEEATEGRTLLNIALVVGKPC